MSHEDRIDELERRRAEARAMGSPHRLTERKLAGISNARESIAHLLDEGSFQEVGLHAVSANPIHRGKSPADGVWCQNSNDGYAARA